MFVGATFGSVTQAEASIEIRTVPKVGCEKNFMAQSSRSISVEFVIQPAETRRSVSRTPEGQMLLFQKRFHQGLVDGNITLTFRSWSKPLVKAGGRYRCHPIGVIEVDAIDRVRVADIQETEARAAGFSGKHELIEYLQGHQQPSAPEEVFRVRLHYGGDGDRVPGALNAELSLEDIAAIRAKLQALDERSDAPWTSKTLKLIDRNPRVAASRLAAKVGRETAPFKADVVKLKKLGLTQSFEVGYEISPRGRAFLASKKRRRS